MATTVSTEESLMLTARTQNTVEDTIFEDNGHVHGDSEDFYEPILTAEQQEQANEILSYIQHVLLALAIVVTLINILVFAQKSMRSATSTYLLGVSAFQVFYLLLPTFSHLVKAISTQSGYGYIFYMFYVISYAGSVFRRAGFIVACLLSAERMYAVARPLHVRDSVLAHYPVLLMVVAFGCTAVYHVYLVVKYDIIAIPVPGGPVFHTVMRSEIYVTSSEAIDAAGVGAKVIFAYIPLVVLAVLNVLTIVALRHHSTKRQALQGGGDAVSQAPITTAQRRERQMTITVVTATVFYVLLSLPESIHSIIISLVEEYTVHGREANLYAVVGDVSYACTLLSFITDFVSFAALSSSYRHALLRFIRQAPCWRHKKDDMTAAISMTSNIVTSVSEMH